MSVYLLMFLEIRNSLMSSSFGVKPPALAFSLILTVASNLHPYSTDNKTSRLLVKQFSTVRDTQRSSQLHGEEKKEEGDRGDQEEKRGSQKKRNHLTSNQFPKCSPQPRRSREIHRVK